nr:hypothetical protein CDS [Bradyrhizobium sp.]
MFEYKTPLPETEAAFLFVRSSSATVALSLIDLPLPISSS